LRGIPISDRDKKGVTYVVDTILILVIVVSLISSIMLWAVPYVEDQKVKTAVNAMTQQFIYLNDVISEISREGKNATRYVTMVVERGDIKYDENYIFVLWYSLNSSYNFTVSGLGDGDNVSTIHLLDDGNPSTNPVINSADILWLNGSFQPSLPLPLKEGENHTINASYSFIEAVKIDLKNDKTVVGRIWLFSLYGLSYILSYSKGAITISEKDGAVFYIVGNSASMMDTPQILRDGENLLIRCIQVRTSGFSSIGEGIWHLILSTNRSDLLELNQDVYHMSIKVYGCINESITTYMTDTLGFTCIDDRFYLPYARLTYLWNVCNISIQGVNV